MFNKQFYESCMDGAGMQRRKAKQMTMLQRQQFYAFYLLADVAISLRCETESESNSM